MQTFMPYPSFEKSASVLDWRRLGKQRVEAWQILQILRGNARIKAWQNHPAVLMWRHYEDALAAYGRAICREWIARGYSDTMLQRFTPFPPPFVKEPGIIIRPWWFVSEEFHASHRSNLLRKDGDWYGRFGWKESNDLPYYWPVVKAH